MKNNVISTLALIGGIGLLSYGFYAYIRRQKQLLTDFEYKVLGVKILDANFDNVALELNIRFENKSEIEVVVNSFNLDFMINDIVVGKLTDTDSFVISAKDFSEIPMRIDFDPKLLTNNIIDIVNLTLEGQDVFFSAKGNANIKSSFVRTKVPIDFVTSWSEIIS
jgi:LEA14-like dessication related protein